MQSASALPAFVNKAYQRLLDMAFPPRCVVCRKEGAYVCATCKATTRAIGQPFCAVCAEPLPDGASAKLCRRCAEEPLKIDGIRSAYYYEGAIKQAILQLKFHNLKATAPELTRDMADYFNRNKMSADAILPVPSHMRRLRERGYNQASLLAKELSRMTGVPYLGNALRRVTMVGPQARSASREERRSNVQGAFACRDASVAGKSVLVVDDICTTGYTLEACAAALRSAGAAEVRALTLAREA